MKGIMKEGNDIQFLSSINGYGVTSLVAKLVLNEYVLFRHRADTKTLGSRSVKKSGQVAQRVTLFPKKWRNHLNCQNRCSPITRRDIPYHDSRSTGAHKNAGGQIG